MENFFVNIAVPGTYYFVMVAGAILLLFILLEVIIKPLLNGNFKGLISVGVFGALLFGIYAMSSGEKTGKLLGKDYSGISEGVMKFVSAGINVTLFMIIAAFALWIILEIVNLAK